MTYLKYESLLFTRPRDLLYLTLGFLAGIRAGFGSAANPPILAFILRVLSSQYLVYARDSNSWSLCSSSASIAKVIAFVLLLLRRSIARCSEAETIALDKSNNDFNALQIIVPGHRCGYRLNTL